VNAKFHKVV